MMKANATQTSASKNSSDIASAFQHGADRIAHGLLVRRSADQPLDDGARRVFGNAADAAHRRLLGRSDALFRLRDARVQLVFERLAARIGRSGLLVASLISDRLSARARVGKLFLV